MSWSSLDLSLFLRNPKLFLTCPLLALKHPLELPLVLLRLKILSKSANLTFSKSLQCHFSWCAWVISLDTTSPYSQYCWWRWHQLWVGTFPASHLLFLFQHRTWSTFWKIWMKHNLEFRNWEWTQHWTRATFRLWDPTFHPFPFSRR